jgi:YD repeat-containing protein
LNRLVGVVDREGNAAEYVYDAVGNLLQIKRFDVPAGASLAITLVRPSKGAVGTSVQLFGKGFSPTPGDNQVAFNGTPATMSAATATSLTTTVPPGATTGPLTVTVASLTATAPEAFTVLLPMTITPTQAAVAPGTSQQFTASGPAQWKVNGILGGTATLGTISATGRYTAPQRIPTPNTLTVTATAPEDPALSATATVTISAPDQVRGALLSIGPPIAPAQASPLVAPLLSLAVTPPLQASPLPAPLVSLQAPALQANPLAAPLLSLSREPVITGITPATGPQGATGLLVTLSGSGFTGATSLTFLRNGVPDSALTAGALTPSADGRTATALLTIAGSAPLGGRVVQLTTPAGTSTPAGTGTDGFTVTAP